MFRLNFTSRVLGKDAAHRLLQRKVTQTMRSTSDIVLANHHGLMEIGLDGRLLGIAKHLSTDTVTLDDLTIEDARRSGFDSISGWTIALRRAGYRFKPIEEYSFFRVQFEWVGGK